MVVAIHSHVPVYVHMNYPVVIIDVHVYVILTSVRIVVVYLPHRNHVHVARSMVPPLVLKLKTNSLVKVRHLNGSVNHVLKQCLYVVISVVDY
jgi:hypothetical protein